MLKLNNSSLYNAVEHYTLNKLTLVSRSRALDKIQVGHQLGLALPCEPSLQVAEGQLTKSLCDFCSIGGVSCVSFMCRARKRCQTSTRRCWDCPLRPYNRGWLWN
mmetsp:Transcript_81528/g.174720  ORF Transcript_81528/g.174720 Transcript_81528/m.174720 type:complete len:105 (-) Transcript_81528:735-1049(-)